MKGVKSRVMSVALCSAMAITTIGSDVSLIANAEENVAEEVQAEETVEPTAEESDEVEEAAEEISGEDSEETESEEIESEEATEATESEEREKEEDQDSEEKEEEKEEVASKKLKASASEEVKLIASFDFDDEESGFEGAGAKAINHGVKIGDTDLVRNAAFFNGENAYLEVETKDGESLLTDKEEITISYLRQADKSGKSWTFYAAPNKSNQVYRSEKYIGALDLGSNITVERYNSEDNDRPSQLSVSGIKSKWDHIVIVLGKDYTAVYENGKLKDKKNDYSFDTDMRKMLKDNSILQVGKANWDGGEYFGGYIDDYRIYEGAMKASEVSDLYSQFEEKITEKPEESEEPEVVSDKLQADYEVLEIFNADDIRGNINLPAEGKYGSKITWKSADTDVITDKASKNEDYASTPAGVVTRQAKDVKVKLTATIELDGDKKEKEFEVTVKAKYKQEKTTDYLFAYFTGNTVSGENIYFATSQDGFNYDELNGGEYVLTSEKGEKGLRDPYIMRSHEGDKFYMIATDLSIGRNGDWGRAQNAGSQAIMVWESTDLINWSKQRMVTITDSIDAGCTWAPEAYYDEITGEYVVFWASKIANDNYSLQRIYYSKTRDFNTFTKPQVWIDRKTASTIDTTVVAGNDGYLYRISKNEGNATLEDGTKVTGSTVYMERAKSLFGTWTKVKAPSLEKIGGVEGPTSYKLNTDDADEDTWCVLLDHFGGKGYAPVVTTDLANGEFKVPSKYSLPKAPRHGTVLNITSDECKALVDHYGIKEPEEDPTEIKVPEDVLFFIDSGADSSTKYDEINKKHKLLNEAPDQIYEEGTWGIVNEGETNDGRYNSDADDVYSDGWWARGGKNCEYIVPLANGEYKATAIYNEWWSVTRPMKFYVTYTNDEGKQIKTEAKKVTISGSTPRTMVTLSFKVENVAKSTEVHFITEKDGSSDPVISGLMISGTAQPESTKEVDYDTTIKLTPATNTRFNDTDGDSFGEFQGWGTSLCWWANRLGYSEKLTKEAAKAFFSDDGLNLNIGRYNVGGGDDPDEKNHPSHIIRSDSGVPGYCVDVTKMDLTKHKLSYYVDKFDRADKTSGYAWNYDWSADQNQLNILIAAAKASGDDFIAEAFSNSPPYFMTVSGCSSGNTDANKDNLREDCVEAFACYMADVIEHINNEENGVKFQSTTPMNEPYTNYWQANSNKQEGCHFDLGESQSRILVALNKELKNKGIDIIISASDETSIDTAIDSYKALSDEAKDVVTRIDTHTYSGSKRSELAKTAAAGKENLWMSEVDGAFTGGQSAGEMSAAIGMGGRIATDIKGLDCTAWIMWNAVDMHVDSSKAGQVWVKKGSDNDYLSASDMEKAWKSRTSNGYWGVAAADHDNEKLILSKKYYGFGQYTRYIRPGMTIIGANGSTLAAYDPKEDKLVVVAINSNKNDKMAKIDMSGFDELTENTKVTAIRTSGSLADGENWADVSTEDSITVSSEDAAVYANLLANSITTYIMEGVHYSGKGSGEETGDGPAVDRDMSKLEEIELTKDMLSGSTPWNNDKNADVDKTIDGNLSTFFDGLEGGYLTVDLGEATEIKAFSFAPRKGYTSRMLGGAFYGSVDGEKYVMLHEISSTEAPEADVLTTVFAEEFEKAGGKYRYFKYEPADGQCANIAEIKLYRAKTEKEITTYSSFSGAKGAVYTDTNGNVIQAHGGQIQKLTVDGVTKYYWIGEDKTNDYRPCPGVHLYSSEDLYNWTDEGLVLRTMTSESDFDNEYFKALYGGRNNGELSEKQKAIYTDLWAGSSNAGCVIERPKMLYNEKTGKYVLFFHADGNSPYSSDSSSDYAKAKLGIAVSDTVNGPYKLLGTYLLHTNTGYDSDWDAENGHVRDMNVFKDDDGTAYVMYSSDGNANMYIAKLNDDYTGLALSGEDENGNPVGVEGVDYTVNFVGESREAPAMFKKGNKYYMITSGCTGWAPNAAKYAVADLVLGPWTLKNNPCTDDGASTTYDTQSTCVVDLGEGRFMYMGDRWSNPDKGYLLRDSRYVWLPIEFTSDGGIKIEKLSNWDLSIFDSLKSYDVLTKLPETAASVTELKEALPKQLEIRYEGSETTEFVDVVWEEVTANDYAVGDVTVKGTLANGRNVTFTAQVVNDKLIYFFDCAATQEGVTDVDDSFYTAIKNKVGKQLLNSELDQAYRSDNHAGYAGSLTDDIGVKNSSSDIWGHGFWARGNKNVDYSFDLKAGKYAVDLGFAEWWNTTRPLRITVYADGEEISGKNFTLKSSDTANQQTVLFELEKAATVTVSVSKTGNPDGVLSWIALIKTDLAKVEPTPEPAPTPAPTPTPRPSTGGQSGSGSSSGGSSSGSSSGGTASQVRPTPTPTPEVVVADEQVPLAGEAKPATKPSAGNKPKNNEVTEEVAAEETEATETVEDTEAIETEATETEQADSDTQEIEDAETPTTAMDEGSSSFGKIVAAVLAGLAVLAAAVYSIFFRKRKL
ncbi:MAG: family 43 glycosylhydrolase [Pseudobutyrivibrio sp.]|nr:family 43 glycosylhydrolase [Pseudobutyrivibrio sp.]